MITAAVAEAWYQLGYEYGFLRGRLEVLLARRFGPIDDDVRARLAEAPLATLERWLERALTATSLDDALADK